MFIINDNGEAIRMERIQALYIDNRRIKGSTREWHVEAYVDCGDVSFFYLSSLSKREDAVEFIKQIVEAIRIAKK